MDAYERLGTLPDPQPELPEWMPLVAAFIGEKGTGPHQRSAAPFQDTKGESPE